MRALCITILFLFVTAVAMAQKKGVIVNMTDGVPIRDVKIYTNRNTVATTDWRGEYSIPGNFTSVTIVHPHYMSLTLNLYEMSDTIELIPKYESLDEVIVYGRAPRPGFNVKKSLGTLGDFMNKPTGMDFLSVFRKHEGLSKKQRAKHDEIIKNY